MPKKTLTRGRIRQIEQKILAAAFTRMLVRVYVI